MENIYELTRTTTETEIHRDPWPDRIIFIMVCIAFILVALWYFLNTLSTTQLIFASIFISIICITFLFLKFWNPQRKVPQKVQKYWIEKHDYEGNFKSFVSRSKHGSSILKKSLYVARKWSIGCGSTYGYHVVDQQGNVIAKFQNGKRI